MIATEKKPVRKPSTARKVPESLVYEIMDGEPLYYRGYKEVLSGKKTLEEITGSSLLHAFIVEQISRVLFAELDLHVYRIFSSRTDLHINHRNNMSNDVAVYRKSVLTADKITCKYADVPCQLAVEIDIKADVSNPKDYYYVQKKIQKLLDFGVEKVIWIFTGTRKVTVAPQGQYWLTVDWNKEIELIDGLVCSVGNFISKEGVLLEKED